MQAAASQAAPTQEKLLPLGDDDVIRVRQQPMVKNTTQPASQATPIAVQSQVQISAQRFLQQRQMRVANESANVNTSHKATLGAATATTVVFASIQVAAPLVQKMDQLNLLSQGATKAANGLEPQALGSYTGANFKAAAQLHAASIAPESASIDLGQRFTDALLGDVGAQQAARQMQDQMGQQLQRMVMEGRWQASLSLKPAHLGQVSVNLVMEEGVLQTQLLSGNAAVRELLEASLPRLREQLEQSGLQLADVSVGSENKGQHQTHLEQPDWQLSQAKDAPTLGAPETAVKSSTHDGDLDTFA
jgi:flagellar hook-length control protein FliK